MVSAVKKCEIAKRTQFHDRVHHKRGIPEKFVFIGEIRVKKEGSELRLIKPNQAKARYIKVKNKNHFFPSGFACLFGSLI
jgi:hypothetical protein